MTMLGAIIGDIIGSRFEKNNYKSTDFELFTQASKFTDDTVLTIAIADALLTGRDYAASVKHYARRYPLAGYGGTFKKWMVGIISGPYNSWGNGSAMRVSPIGYAFDTESDILEEAGKSAAITHNHPEGIRGAQAIALGVYLARTGHPKEEIKAAIVQAFGYDLDRKIDDIRPGYAFDVSCQGSVPEAIIAFLESTDFESTIRLAISLGGDSDTIACMAGALAEAYYGQIPAALQAEARRRLPRDFVRILDTFSAHYCLPGGGHAIT